MNWKLDRGKPICPQLCQQLCARIAAGELKPGQKIMSVRELAVAAGVNPNTVQNAFSQLEEKGVLYSERGSGWYVSPDITAARELRKSLAEEKLRAFLEEMDALGIGREEIKSMVEVYDHE